MAEKKIKNNKEFTVPSPFSDELLFPKMVDHNHLLGWTFDIEQHIFECSESLKSVFNLEKNSSLTLENFISMIHPDDQRRMTLQWHEAIKYKAPLMTLFRMRINLQVHWFEMIARLDQGNHQTIYLGTFQDVTYAIHRESSTMSKEDEPKRNLLSTISHELRTPMNAIIGFVDILEKEIQDTNQKIYVERIRDASHHMLSMINDVLDLSKIEVGKLNLEHVSFSLEKLIHSVLQMVEPLAKRKHLFLESEQLDCPDFLMGDVHRIRQILINLLSNAIKFTETGGISFVVKGENVTNHSSITLHFIVKDTGIGMTDQQLSRLFRDFEQADSSISRLYGGTGLGLSISSKLAHLMHGKISVESKLNEGSTFTLTLPLDISDDEQSHEKPQIIDLERFKHTKVLIAEDHHLSQMLIEHILSSLGAQITLVEDGKKAVDLAKSSPYEWIILDMEMPIMGGIEAAKLIRRFNEKTPILAMTANHLDDDRARCLLAGMNDVITKPIDRNHLLSTMLKWLPEINGF